MGEVSGGKMFEMIRRVLPGFIREITSELKNDILLEYAVSLLTEQIRMLSDSI